jgi:ribosomal subunit interface protein
MVQKFEVTGVHFEIDKKMYNYVSKKLGSLDRYIPRHSRNSAHLEILLSESKLDGKQQSICEATLYLPHETINLTEKGANMFASIDIVSSKLKQLIQKYKDEHANGKQRRHIIGRIRRRLSSRSST